MTRAARWSIAAAALLLTLLGFVVGDTPRDQTATTFGTVPSGYGAIFELFAELNLPVARTYAPPEQLPPNATVWWIAPQGICDKVTAVDPDGLQWSAANWLESGGTAVIFLSKAACAAIAGVALPARVAGRSHGHESPMVDDRQEEQQSHSADVPLVERVIAGAVTSTPRHVSTSGLRAFDAAGSWQVDATADGRPFVLVHPLGRGRLVVVADSTLLENAWLDHADAALFAADMVRAYGTPLFDERAHGLRAPEGALRYLVQSVAVPVFFGLGLIGVLFLWAGAAEPPAALPEADENVPTLERFVDSLAALYSTTRDYALVLDHYRGLTAAQLRRQFGLPPETSRRALVDRLRRWHGMSSATLDALADNSPVADSAALHARVRALDALVREATQ